MVLSLMICLGNVYFVASCMKMKFKIVYTIGNDVDPTNRLRVHVQPEGVRGNDYLGMLILGIAHVISFPTMPAHHCATNLYWLQKTVNLATKGQPHWLRPWSLSNTYFNVHLFESSGELNIENLRHLKVWDIGAGTYFFNDKEE